MTADPAQPTIRVYQLKIVLRDISPLVWRRVLVTSETTIAALHAIVQTVMGWEDLHLHQFRVHGKAYGVYRGGGVTTDDDDAFVEALARMHDRLEDAPSAFSRRAVNAALRTMREGGGHARPYPTHRRGG